MAKTPVARVALAADGAVARRRAEIVEYRPVACVGVPYERFRPVCSTVCLLALMLPSFGVGGVLLAPERAEAAGCTDGSPLAAQIALAGMHRDDDPAQAGLSVASDLRRGQPEQRVQPRSVLGGHDRRWHRRRELPGRQLSRV